MTVFKKNESAREREEKIKSESAISTASHDVF